jgi:transposase
MAMGTRKRRERQQSLWIASSEVVQPAGHPFYEQLQTILNAQQFDSRVEQLCRRYYQGPYGQPSIAPGTYFRMLLVGYLEGLTSERAIAWRVADSLSLRRFLGYLLDEKTPDHSTISRTRRLLSVETHRAIFAWVLGILEKEKLVVGQRVGIDATTLEANAALRSIVRRDNGQKYQEFLTSLAQNAGIENPTREQLARLDRKRKKKGSNDDWKHPQDPDARVTKMKDGRTHLAHKAEHAVDLSSGAILAVTLQGADQGDTTTMVATLAEAQDAAREINGGGIDELTADKGYHSSAVLDRLHLEDVRSYLPEPDRGRRCWQDRSWERRQVYANRQRMRGTHGRQLLRKRGELLERSFAHLYDTGGMRRLHLRGRENILKRLLVHAAGFNLSLVMRKKLGAGTPRQAASLARSAQAFRTILQALYCPLQALCNTVSGLWRKTSLLTTSDCCPILSRMFVKNATTATGC